MRRLATWMERSEPVDRTAKAGSWLQDESAVHIHTHGKRRPGSVVSKSNGHAVRRLGDGACFLKGS